MAMNRFNSTSRADIREERGKKVSSMCEAVEETTHGSTKRLTMRGTVINHKENGSIGLLVPRRMGVETFVHDLNPVFSSQDL